jgi:hypothetical protein
MGRIQLDDSMMSALMKMCEGNPGGLNVLMELVRQVPCIDPACALGGLHYVLQLDDLGLYGPKIWMLFKDVCGQKIEGIVVLFRAWQLGHLSATELRRIIDEDEPYDWKPLVALIRADVPEFKAVK